MSIETQDTPEPQETAPAETAAADAAPADAAPADAAPADAAATDSAPAEPGPEEAAPAAASASAPDTGEGPVELPELEDFETFEAWVDTLMDAEPFSEGTIVTGKVTTIDEIAVTVAVDDDNACEIDRDEFLTAAGELTAAVGDSVEVYVERTDQEGIHLSREKAEKLGLWNALFEAAKHRQTVTGTIIGRTKGGFHVAVEGEKGGVRAFLPGSQLDIRPRKGKQSLGESFEFQVIKFDRGRANIVLSRRTLLEKEREGLKEETLNSIRVGAIMNGIVRSVRDYGCFVDVGGIDGLLHVTDMSWGRISHPKALVSVGDEITVQVLTFDTGTEKLKLGMKQVTEDPWVNFERKYRVGQRIEGKVVGLTDFGAFVEIEDGIEGLVHVSAMSWTQRVNKPGDMVKMGETVEAVILDIDGGNRRVSLGMKQAQANPWQTLADRMPIGTRIKGKIKSVTSFGVFLGIEEGIDGLVHVSDLSWTENIKDPADHYKAGDEVEAVLLGIDVENERASLGIKQLSVDPWANIEDRYPIGRIIEGKALRLLDFGIIVQVEEYVEGLVHISEISEDRVEDITEHVNVGDTVTAKVISLTADQRKMGLSIKRASEDEAMGEHIDEPAHRTTIGDLIAEKIDISQLPTGKDD